MADGLALSERTLRRRRFTLDKTDVVDLVLKRVRTARDERTDWMQNRLQRYAKTRGWLETKSYPWENCSNQHLPVMQANTLRVKAGLYNAVLGIRPVMTPKVQQRAHKAPAEQANALIDYQIFMEGNGEEKIGQYIDAFVDDGTAIAFTSWVKRREAIVDVKVQPYPTERTLAEAMPDLLTGFLKSLTDLTMVDDDGYSWTGTLTGPDGEDQPVTVEVYDRDEQTIEIHLMWSPIVFEGPALHVPDLEDVIVPMRCENPQPVTPQNPDGAPWIARAVRVNRDHVRRMKTQKVYDLLTDDDLETLEGPAEPRVPTATANNEQILKEHKDQAAGLTPGVQDPDEDRDWFTAIEYYGAWDLNGDGLDEEVIFTVLEEPELLVRARYLTEIYPGAPITRPFAKTEYIPVKGQFYGIGLPELMEGLHDFLHVIFNQSIDNGTLANQMFFFYRASSGLKPEIIRLWPGEGYPLDNPQQDVHFPAIPQRDQSLAFNMITIGMQFLDKLTQIGPLQQGQVPAGRASALRTASTTMAILQQGAAMPEQVLRRLFHGLGQVWQQVHKLNGRFLPKQKQYLVVGKSPQDEEAYATIPDPQAIAVPILFDFQATLLNTNKGLVTQALVQIGSAVINPLTLQMGIADAESVYNWSKDLIQAAQLDHERYIKRPKGMPEGERITAEEAISLLLSGQFPEPAPLEPVQDHYQKLVKFRGSPEYQAVMLGNNHLLFDQYLQRVQQLVRQDMAKQQMMQAAQQFAASMGNKGEGAGPVPGAPPEMQTQSGTMDELMGAINANGS